MYKHKPIKVLSLRTNLALPLESQPSENSALCNRFSHWHGRNVKCPSCRRLLFIFLALGSFLQRNFGIIFNWGFGRILWRFLCNLFLINVLQTLIVVAFQSLILRYNLDETSGFIRLSSCIETWLIQIMRQITE